MQKYDGSRTEIDLTCTCWFSLPWLPHLVCCHGEDGDGVSALHLSHDGVLPHSPEQLHPVNSCEETRQWRRTLSNMSHKASAHNDWRILTSLQDQTCICSPVSDELFKNLSGQNKKSQPIIIIIIIIHQHFLMLFGYLCGDISQHLLNSEDDEEDRSVTLLKKMTLSEK